MQKQTAKLSGNYSSQMGLRLVFLVALSLVLWKSKVSANQGFNWAYGGSNGPSHWFKNYPNCGGIRQSPINVETDKVEYDANLKPFVVELNQAFIGEYTLENLGLNTEITFDETPWYAYVKGDLGSCYRLLQVHFHWGSNNSVGSEHTIDGKRFPLEAHFVMWNCKLYENAHAAAGGANGIAVMSILFKLDDSVPANPVMEQITAALRQPNIRQCPCQTPSDIAKLKIDGFDVNQLLPRNRKDFYRYQGSFTTPPCTENVMWTIFKEHVTITTDQIKSFRNLLNRGKYNGGKRNMGNNFRPVNKLNPPGSTHNGRVVTASFNPDIHTQGGWWKK